MDKPCVYIIKCPDTNLVRYVGMTHTPRIRFSAHMGNKTTDVGKWIQSLLENDKMPIFEVVKNFKKMPKGKCSWATDSTCDLTMRMSSHEDRLIKKYLKLKHPLFNKNGNIAYQRVNSKYRKAFNIA